MALECSICDPESQKIFGEHPQPLHFDPCPTTGKHFAARNNQSLKGAVDVTHGQNEAEVKCQMDIDQYISPTEKAGAMRLIELLVLRVNSGGNLHWKIYFCLILAEDRANCSFIYLRQAWADPISPNRLIETKG